MVEIIREERLLLVEGKDDTKFFRKLCEHLGLIDQFTFQEYGGTSKLIDALLPLLNDLPRFQRLRHLAIVRDADYTGGAFASVQSTIQRANNNAGLPGRIFPIPQEPMVTTGEDLKVSVLILPDAQRDGMLENLIIDALEGDPLMQCVNDYFVCADRIRDNDAVVKQNRIPKAIMQVFESAIMQQQAKTFFAGKNAYEDASKRDWKARETSDIYSMSWWTWEHPAFGNVKRFLQQLANT